MAVFRARTVTSSYALGTSFSVAVPAGTQYGDLLLIAIACGEISVGFSALIQRPVGFTDLLTDGFDPGAGYGLQYVLDPGAFTPRVFVYVGYRFATSEPASYAVATTGTTSGFQGEMFAYALPGDILATALDHVDATTGVPVAAYNSPSVALDANHRALVCLMFGGYMSTAVANNGYVPPVSMALQARDSGGGAPNDSWTVADEAVAGSGASSGTRAFTLLTGTVTNRAAIVLALGGTVAAVGGLLPLTGAG